MYNRIHGAVSADAGEGLGSRDPAAAAAPGGEDPAARRLLRNALLVSLRRVTVA